MATAAPPVPPVDDAAKLAAEEAERQRLADEDTARAEAEAEQRRKDEEAERQRLADANKSDADKERDRIAYELRQTQKKLDAVTQENSDYKRRAEEERKAKLTEEQRIKEERDQFQRELESLRLENLQKTIAAEFKLPPTLATRIRGTDEAAMRADAEELAQLVSRPRIGTTTDPPRSDSQVPTFKRSQLRDPEFYRANEAAIKAAAAAGRITND